MTTTRKTWTACCLPVLFWLAAACAGMGSQTQPAQPQTTTVTFSLPQVTPITGTEELQDRDGITIAVSTTPFREQRHTRVDCEQLPTFVTFGDQYPYEVTTTPYYVVEPGQIIFEVQIINNLDRVLRLEGTLVRFNVDGQAVTLPADSGVDEMLGGFLAPREQRTYTIQGPRTAELPDTANMALMFYDVVTQTDAAGTPTQRSNFEWFYQYNVQQESRNESVTVEERDMTPQEARALQSTGPAIPASTSTAGTPPLTGACSDTCRFAYDNECDDGGSGAITNVCGYGTDCADCGPR